MLEDFVILDKSQCNARTRTGVCRDSVVGGSNDLEMLMSSYIDGLIKVTFRRPLATLDVSNDLPILINKHMFVIAAIGTLDTGKNPSYHTVAVNTKFPLTSKHKPVTAVDFGRPHHHRNCSPSLWRQVISQPANIFNTIQGTQVAEAHTLFEVEPWKSAVIKAQNGHVFRVVIGPAGNSNQGYTSITGIESPGKAFWINDLLIPELHLIRGHNYTFLIETGNNASFREHYHPFYITDSREGGEYNQLKLGNLPGQRLYAGVRLRGGVADPSAGTGRYCELKVDRKVDIYTLASIEEFRKTLTLACEVSVRMLRGE